MKVARVKNVGNRKIIKTLTELMAETFGGGCICYVCKVHNVPELHTENKYIF